MDKITMADAKTLENEGYAIFHIAWFSRNSGYGILHAEDLESKHPDCSHVLISPDKRWHQAGAVAALIRKEFKSEN